MDKFVELAGLRTRYREAGSGPAVMLLHGASLGSSCEVFEANIGPLAAHGLHVLAPDWPGFGLTAQPEGSWTSAYRRDHVLRFMDALEIEKATLVGHSMSGSIALQLAFDRPDRVAKVVVLGSGSLLPPLPDQPPRAGGDPMPADEPSLEWTRGDMEANAFDHSKLTSEVVKRRHELSVGPNYQAAKARLAAPPEPKPEGPPLWQRLDQIPVPELFIYGKQDRGSAAERAELARQRYPNLNLVVLDGCKHLIPYDKGPEMVELVAEFVLEKAPARS
jgi:pimeloyl-ACP methyl ester carboxylesterase